MRLYFSPFCSLQRATKKELNPANLRITTDTIHIPINANLLSYYRLTNYNKTLGELYIYNEPYHIIDIFSLKTKTYKKSIKLFRQGPETIETPNDILTNNSGDLFVLDNYYISKIELASGTMTSRNKVSFRAEDVFFQKHFFFPSKEMVLSTPKKMDFYTF